MSWFRNLDDASLDLLPLDGFEPWVYSDLVQNRIQETVDPRRYSQIAVAVAIMEFERSVAVQAAHRRQLLSVGSLQTRSTLLSGCASPRSATLGDVYIDDLVIQAMVHFSDCIGTMILLLPNTHWVWWSPRRDVGQHSNTRYGEAI